MLACHTTSVSTTSQTTSRKGLTLGQGGHWRAMRGYGRREGGYGSAVRANLGEFTGAGCPSGLGAIGEWRGMWTMSCRLDRRYIVHCVCQRSTLIGDYCCSRSHCSLSCHSQISTSLSCSASGTFNLPCSPVHSRLHHACSAFLPYSLGFYALPCISVFTLVMTDNIMQCLNNLM
jgi:hypothetical protein